MALFRLHKSVRCGPLRFNFSRSGVGVSVGVRGLRIGAGPRGHYVHIGAGGVFYRRTLGKSTPTPTSSPSPRNALLPSSPLAAARATVDAPVEIESADISQLADASAADLLEDIRRARSRIRLVWLAALLFVAAPTIAAAAQVPTWISLALAVLGAGLVVVTYIHDVLAKSVVLYYEIESDAAQRYEAVLSQFENVRHCAARWHVATTARVRDRKYHAGASDVVTRSPVGIQFTMRPPNLRLNLAAPLFPVGRQTLLFLPNCLLVFDPNGVGAVSYRDLTLEVSSTRFIESARVPSDAQVVDYTYKFVNKKGGPDRRFKDNPRLAIALYEDIHFQSSTGLNELVQVSKTGVGEPLRQALAALDAG